MQRLKKGQGMVQLADGSQLTQLSNADRDGPGDVRPR